MIIFALIHHIFIKVMFRTKAKLLPLLLLTLISISNCCIGLRGTAVGWWVQLIAPGKLKNSYGYMDSLSKQPTFEYRPEKADSDATALARTLTQINTKKMQSIAWSDDWPTGKTSGTKAHAKAVIAFDDNYQTGFYFGHSIPEYPAFDGFTVNKTIDADQSIYGQHVFCIALNTQMLRDLLNLVLPIKPFVFARNIRDEVKYSEIVSGKDVAQPDYKSKFTNKQYTVNKNNYKFIFKNGALNSSIFEDGLNYFLESSLVAETWGRPLQEPYCSNPFPVFNVQRVQLAPDVAWQQTQDHSKWAYPIEGDYGCFGDMNRMTSQWKRGGAFFCIKSRNLKEGLKAVVVSVQDCMPQNNTMSMAMGIGVFILVSVGIGYMVYRSRGQEEERLC